MRGDRWERAIKRGKLCEESGRPRASQVISKEEDEASPKRLCAHGAKLRQNKRCVETRAAWVKVSCYLCRCGHRSSSHLNSATALGARASMAYRQAVFFLPSEKPNSSAARHC